MIMVRDYFSFFVCPECGAVTVSENRQTYCCGKELKALEAIAASDDEKLDVCSDDGQLLITSHFPQSRDDYISFVCMVCDQRYELVRLFPEWEVNVRMTKYGKGRAKLFFYRTGSGKLMFQTV